jgi:hypothetical protein
MTAQFDMIKQMAALATLLAGVIFGILAIRRLALPAREPR